MKPSIAYKSRYSYTVVRPAYVVAAFTTMMVVLGVL